MIVRRVRAGVGVLCGALVVAACSSEPPPAPPQAAQPTLAPGGQAPEARDRWVFEEAEAVSTVQATDVTAAFTTHVDGDGLQAVVLDMATGSERWRVPTLERGRPDGTTIAAPTIVDTGDGEIVVTLEPIGLAVAWVARDARTGTERWWVPTLTSVVSRPCGESVCLGGRTRARERMIDATTGEEVVRQEGSPVPTLVGVDPVDGEERWRLLLAADQALATHIGDEVVVLFELGSPRLRALDLAASEQLWTVDLGAAFGGADTAGGWSFHSAHRGDEELVVVSVSRQPRTPDEATPSGVAAVALADGSVAWLREGIELVPFASRDDGPFVAATVEWAASRGTWSRLERLDPATGDTVWERTLDPPFPLEQVRYHRGDGAEFWVSDGASEWLGIDLDSGAELTPSPGAVVWEAVVEQVAVSGEDGASAERRVGGRWQARELPSGAPVDSAELPSAHRRGAGEDWQVWVDGKGRVHAARDA